MEHFLQLGLLVFRWMSLNSLQGKIDFLVPPRTFFRSFRRPLARSWDSSPCLGCFPVTSCSGPFVHLSRETSAKSGDYLSVLHFGRELIRLCLCRSDGIERAPASLSSLISVLFSLVGADPSVTLFPEDIKYSGLLKLSDSSPPLTSF